MAEKCERTWRGKGFGGRTSNLISIITKKSREAIGISNVIFFHRTAVQARGIYKSPLSFYLSFFFSLSISISRQLQYFRISVAMIFHGETKRSSAGGPHFNQYTRLWSAYRESFPYCAPSALGLDKN